MFTSKQAMTAREVGSAHDRLTALLRTRDDWYDGTVASVDARIASIENTLPSVVRVASFDSDMLDQAEQLRADRRALLALKDELLSGLAPARRIPRQSSVGPASREARQFIATNLRRFLAENADAMGDPAEMDERAEEHAEIETLQLPPVDSNSVVAHFRIAVNWSVRNHIAEQKRLAERQRPQRTASVEDYPDDMLFG